MSWEGCSSCSGQEILWELKKKRVHVQEGRAIAREGGEERRESSQLEGLITTVAKLLLFTGIQLTIINSIEA